ncbi:hypothetical protein [uncultured Photobacterium sp.]|uniref:hypothetical protein n=1 Tax=uncultured Photobacterium sp. TaxID=173973 RepID=UPI00263021B5|nr:hypothetical protein [uncultured Photobacterium sp.]
MKKILVAVLVTAALSGGGFFYFQEASHAAEKKATFKRLVGRGAITQTEIDAQLASVS